MTGIERCLRSVETVDFPDAIPPVRPTTTEYLLGVGKLITRVLGFGHYQAFPCLELVRVAGSKHVLFSL